ncbi:hypothetical protein [Natronomonas sp.]|uniref:hypothetical protein n=1 Tax=Natronomonas sp. TaxID=2184060 RepID=UPI002FC3DEB4
MLVPETPRHIPDAAYARVGDGLDGAFVGLLLFGLTLASALEHALVVLPFLAIGAAGALGAEISLARLR